jgi:UDP-2,3-diacylglucosamine pyrophosphatase LpxH
MIVFIGDVHGEFTNLAQKLVSLEVRNSSFIQVGDFGVGFKTKEKEAAQLQELNEELKKGDNVMYAIRGNHDDPAYFKRNSGYSNLFFLKDYSLLELEGKIFLLAGGGISIDRSSRVLNNSYWKEELFVFKESLLDRAIEKHTQIDIVVTHNAPAEFHPTEMSRLVFDWCCRDSELLTDLKAERYRHSLLMNHLIGRNLRPKFWYYGHYHFSYQSSFEGLNYRILDCLEFYEHR